jgi:hypothetical protein
MYTLILTKQTVGTHPCALMQSDGVIRPCTVTIQKVGGSTYLSVDCNNTVEVKPKVARKYPRTPTRCGEETSVRLSEYIADGYCRQADVIAIIGCSATSISRLLAKPTKQYSAPMLKAIDDYLDTLDVD